MTNENHQFVEGDAAYRGKWDKVEKGVVVKIRRIDLDSQGRFWRENPEGEYIETTAVFGFDAVRQTYCWQFFPTADEAQQQLVRDLNRRINDLNRDLAKVEALKVLAEAGTAPVFGYDDKRYVRLAN